MRKLKTGVELLVFSVMVSLLAFGYRTASAGVPEHWPRIPPTHAEMIVATASSQY